MKLKRRASLALAILFALSCILNNFGGIMYVSGVENTKEIVQEEEKVQSNKRYFYNQLPEEAKGFYDAMYNMYVQGILKTGTGDYELVKNGHVTKEQLDGYANGNMTLLNYMGAARDAFYADYPEIFYVDFSYLSLRVNQKGQEYCAYLGPGRSDNYFTKGFTSQEEVEAAILEYEARVNNIVEAAEKLTAEEGRSLKERQVIYVHDEIIHSTSYRLENTCKKENIGHVRTAYGALVQKESLCEGYSRAVKVVLDRLDIPCVLVVGGYQVTSDKIEPHMWNYVQVDNEWFGLDATMDDPKPPIPGEEGVDGFERSDYLLVGEEDMSKRHISDGIMSEANFEFTYPVVSKQDLLFQEVVNENGLKVLYNSDAVTGELQTGVFKVSYNDMGAAKTIESGKYMLMREAEFVNGQWQYSRWAYILPDVYVSMNDSDTELILNFPSVEYLEFAITSEAPGDYKTDMKYLSFYGDPLLFDAQTEVLYNPSGTYTPPPYVKKAIPSLTSRILIGKTHHVSITFDEELKLAEGETKGNVQVSMLQEDTTALQYCKIENFTWSKDTITFDFTPSDMWLDDSVDYIFNTVGLIGIKSEKVPKSFTYTASYKKVVCAYRSSGYYWNYFGRPQLLESSDLSKKNFQEWKTEDGSGVTPDMMTGLTLVVSSPSHVQTDSMNHMINQQLSDDKLLKSETYNIKLSTCNQNIVSVGDSIRLSVGFPVGYGPDDAGVTFKAYHFKRDKSGVIIGMEEVPCTVTRYGLVILCKSFSPFAIVAVKEENGQVKREKSLVISTTQGGSVAGADAGILTLSEGETRELTIQADDGYVIDTVVAGGKYIEIADQKTMKVKVDCEKVKDGDIVEVQFAAKSVIQKEQERGETPVQPVPKPAEIIFGFDNLSVKEKESFEITPNISVSSGVNSYQWYKNGVPLSGQTKEKLAVKSAAKSDAGEYSLVVTTTVGAVSVKAESSICNVKVILVDDKDNFQKPGVLSPSLKAVTGLKVVSTKTDRVKLQWKKVPNADGYQVLCYHASKKKFVKVANVVKTTYTDKKKVAGKPYRYKVMAYKKVDGTIYYGSLSKETKVLVKPKVPGSVKAKRLSESSVQISFKKVKNAVSYEISKYKKSGKKSAVYKVTSKKIYKYNEKTKKWVYVNKVKKGKNGVMTCKLTGFKKSDKNQIYRVKAVVTKKGYKDQYSAESKKVKVK